MSNILMAIPILLVTGIVAAPFLILDGRNHYMNFLWRNPNLVTATIAGWGVLFYWTTRRTAALVLLRGTGAKLKVGDEPLA